MDIAYLKYYNKTSNSSDFGGINFIRENPKISIPYLALISAFTINGCVGNIMVIGAVLVYKPLRKVGNIFVVNLALADLSVTGFINPFSIVGIVKGQSWFEQRPVLCSIIGTMCLESCFCSLLSIMAISIDRYVHICKNQKYLDIFTKRNAVTICIVLWIFSLLVQIPSYLGWGDYKYDGKNFGCLWDRTHPSPYLFIIFAALVALPTVTILICYYKIFAYAKICKEMRNNIFVRRGACQMRLNPCKITTVSNNASSDKDNSLQLVKTCCTIFVVFATCWTPYTILAIADREDVVAMPVHLYATLVAHMNSSINCIIYGLTNKQFRIGYKKLLGCDKQRTTSERSICETSKSISECTASRF